MTPGSSFEITMMGWTPRFYTPSFVKIGLPVLEKKIFEGFLPYMGRRPSWSCDPDDANRISFPLPKEVPHKIWICLAKRFQRRSLKMVDGRRMDEGRTPEISILYAHL